MLTNKLKVYSLIGLLILLCSIASAETKLDGKRAPWVEPYQTAIKSIVGIGNGISMGSGFILTESGYVLTCNHHLKQEGNNQVMLLDGTMVPYRVVVQNEYYDLALIKIVSDKPFIPAKLGRSSEIKIAEPVMAIGNPYGLTFSATTGVISGVNRKVGNTFAQYDSVLLTDAAVNYGSSGGPLINMNGEVLGVTVECIAINAAIPIDTVLRELPDLINAEARYGYKLGLKLNPDKTGVVKEVVKGSPAEKAGLVVGDVVTSINKKPIVRSLDFILELLDHKGGDKLSLTVKRKSIVLNRTITLGVVPLRAAEQVANLTPGLFVDLYSGNWNKLPDFSKLTSAGRNVAGDVSLDASLKGKNYYGLRFTGYVNVPTDGVYGFFIASDDGSRICIGNQVVTDHDGLHGANEKAGFIPLKAGYHPITIEYFQRDGGSDLKVYADGPGFAKQALPSTSLFHKAN